MTLNQKYLYKKYSVSKKMNFAVLAGVSHKDFVYVKYCQNSSKLGT